MLVSYYVIAILSVNMLGNSVTIFLHMDTFTHEFYEADSDRKKLGP